MSAGSMPSWPGGVAPWRLPLDQPATIAIVGGGASGTLTAVQLLRRAPAGLRVLLIERSGRPGPGVAYGTDDDAHRLNVPAAQMVALPDRPLDFLDWARRTSPETQPQDYLPRGLFGKYLVDLLGAAALDAGPERFQSLTAEVVDIQPGAMDGSVTLVLDDGVKVAADRVIMAVGNDRPGDLPGMETDLRESDLYVADPWEPGALARGRSNGSVLAIGTGLTMVDVAISVGRTGQKVHAVSRHGLLPRAHGDQMPVRVRPVACPGERCSLTEITSRLLTEIAIAGSRGEDWRVTLDSLRPITNDLWQGLDRRDQKRFVADLSRVWGVHRHRMAPWVARQLESLQSSGRLEVHAAAIESASLAEGRVAVDLGVGPDRGTERLLVDRVINCTGPTWDPRRIDQPLVRRLLARGLARPDWLGIGFDVDQDGALIDSDASPSECIFTLGPLRNGVLLETTAIPEIGLQAELLSELLLDGLTARAGRTRERVRA